MSTKPRTPRHYPNMKIRGARRRRLAPLHRFERSTDALTKALTAIGIAAHVASWQANYMTHLFLEHPNQKTPRSRQASAADCYVAGSGRIETRIEYDREVSAQG